MRDWFFVKDIDEYNAYMEDVLRPFEPVFQAHKERLDWIAENAIPDDEMPEV